MSVSIYHYLTYTVLNCVSLPCYLEALEGQHYALFISAFPVAPNLAQIQTPTRGSINVF